MRLPGGLLALLLALPSFAQVRSGAQAPGVSPAPSVGAAGTAQTLFSVPTILPLSGPSPSAMSLAPTLAPVQPAIAASPAAAAVKPTAAAAAPAQAKAAGLAAGEPGAPRGPPSLERALGPVSQAIASPDSKASDSTLRAEADADWARRTGEGRGGLNVLMVGAESVPYAKTGGLADVVDAVSRGLVKRGNKVALVLPKYPQIDAAKHHFRPTAIEVKIPIGGVLETARLWEGHRGGVDVYLLENDKFFSPDGYYAPLKPGYADDDERFIFLARGALEAAKALGFKPDIVHTHDWHSALVAPLLKLVYRLDPFFAATKSVLTLHNMAYQGMFPFSTLLKAGFDAKDFTWDKLEYWGHFNFLKAGLAFADLLTTVSETYAEQIRESNEFGRGMEGLLRFRAADLHGILNGIDPELWDPGIDRLIPNPYTAGGVTLGKAGNKAALQKETGLDLDPDAPLFAVASRFDHQKGLDLVADAIPGLVAKGAQVLLTGSGDAALTARFEEIARRYPGRVFLHPFSETFVHKVYAGADFVLMPSRFEPCGLTQLISQRYGTLPIVARTGGLADTVTDVADDAKKGDGLFMREFSSAGLIEAADRAIDLMRDRKKLLRHRLIAMEKDSSWGRAIEQYERLFKRLLSR